MEKKHNPNLLPKGYFSRQSVPYWCIVGLDSVVLVMAGVTSLYVIFGGLGVVNNFWDSMKIWIMALPIFLLYMHLFRTYVGTMLDTPIKLMLRLALALLAGGITLRLAILLIPDAIFDFTPGSYVIGVAVLISLVVQWSLRMVARFIFKGHESPERIFFRTLKMGDFSDVSLRAKKKINLCLAHMSETGEEMKYIKEAFDTNWVVPLGPNVNAFEQDLEAFVNIRYESEKEKVKVNNQDSKVVALSAGTAAVHLALRALGVHDGDEVIVQSFTFCASANPVAYIGAVPVFVDSEPLTWNMDPDLLEKAIIDRKTVTGQYPKAIIPVALYGMPYQVERIMEIANRYGIPVIEDAAEGFGSCYKGQKLGTFGQYGVLSFNGNKMITTSGGGALICNGVVANQVRNEEPLRDAPRVQARSGVRSISPEQQAKGILWYATQARESYPYYQHEAIGYNYRLSNVSAGIGRGQMTVVNDHIAHHRHVQAMYEVLLKDVAGIKVHAQPSNEKLGVKSDNPVYDSNYWLCTITLDPDLKIKGQENAYKTVVNGAVGGAAGVVHMTDSPTTDCQPNDNVEALRVYMDQCQVEARPLWKPMHKQPVFKNAPAYVNGVSEGLFKIGLCLPAGPCVSEEDVKYIVNCIKEAIVKA